MLIHVNLIGNEIMIHFSYTFRLCTDLSTLIQERADIEKSYAKSLKQWSKKWGDLIEKGNRNFLEFGFFITKSLSFIIPAATTHINNIL